MRYSNVFIGLIAACLIPALAAPTGTTSEPKPTAYNHGDVVGVRAAKIETKDSSVRSYKKIDIHPAVVVAGPDAEGKYKVATVSNKHLHDPPQTEVSNFHSDLKGNVKLVATDPVKVEDMKPWKSETTGVTTEPMSQENLAKLNAAMKPHVGWKPPVQPEVKASSTAPAQSSRRKGGNRAIPGQAHAGIHPSTPGSKMHLPGSQSHLRVPAGKKGQHINTHAGGSKHPQVQHPAPASHANLKKAPHPNAHVAPSGSKGRAASRPKVAKVNNKVKQPMPNQGASRGRKAPGVKRSIRSW